MVATVILIFIILPFILPQYTRHLVILSFIWSVVAVCWNLLLGYSGINSFGNLVFFAMGGYLSAWLALNMGASPWIGMLSAGCLALLVSVAIGILTLRLRGIYTALFTFALQEMLRYMALLPEATPWTGGPIGLLGVPHFSIANFSSVYLDYYLGFGLFLVTLFVLYKILNSKIGLALVAMRESEISARTSGVNILRFRLIALMVSAFFTGVAGSFYAHYIGIMTDESLSFLLMVSIIFMILIGGLGTLYGPIVGSFLYTFLNEYSKSAIAGAVRPIAISVVLILILIFIPSGIVGSIHSKPHLPLKLRFRKTTNRT